MNTITRRQALLAGLGLASTSALAACGAKQPSPASTTPATWAIPTQTPLATAITASTYTSRGSDCLPATAGWLSGRGTGSG